MLSKIFIFVYLLGGDDRAGLPWPRRGAPRHQGREPAGQPQDRSAQARRLRVRGQVGEDIY